MKLKKFLKLVKTHCKEENCHFGKCPLCYRFKTERGKTLTNCMLAVECVEDWDIDHICKQAKKLKVVEDE